MWSYSYSRLAVLCVLSGLCGFSKCWPADLITAAERIAVISGEITVGERILPLESRIEVDGLAREDLAWLLSSIATKSIENSSSYVSSQLFLRQNYERLLDYGEGCDIEIPGFDFEKERLAIDKLIFVKGKRGRRIYSPRYQAYRSFERKAAELADQISNTANQSKRIYLAAQLANLEELWEKNGLRKTFDEAIRRYETVLESRSGLYWAKARDKLLQWKLTHADGDEVAATQISSILKPDPASWVKISVSSNSNRTSLNATMEYQIVRFERPWLDWRILTEPCWRWRSSVVPFERGMISNGLSLVGSADRSKGVLWAISTGVMLVRQASYRQDGSDTEVKAPSVYGIVIKAVQHLP